LKNAEGIQVDRTWWIRSGIGAGRRGWVGIVRLGSDKGRFCALKG